MLVRRRVGGVGRSLLPRVCKFGVLS